MQPDRSGAADELSATSADPAQMPLKCTSMGNTCGPTRMQTGRASTGVKRDQAGDTSSQRWLGTSLLSGGQQQPGNKDSRLAPSLLPNSPRPLPCAAPHLVGVQQQFGG